MAGLLFIFILLLMGALLQVQEKAEQDEEIVKRYDQIKTQLYIDLQEEFKKDLTVWRATIDSTLCIRFQEPSMLFDEGEDVLILIDFLLCLDFVHDRGDLHEAAALDVREAEQGRE